MLLLKELIDFLPLLPSPAAMRITNLCDTQTLSAAQYAEHAPIKYHLSLWLSFSNSLTHPFTFPLINTLGSVCVLQIQTGRKMGKKRKVRLISAVCWQQAYKGMQSSSKREQYRSARSRDVYIDPSGPFSIHLTSFPPFKDGETVNIQSEPSCCKWRAELKAKNL